MFQPKCTNTFLGYTGTKATVKKLWWLCASYIGYIPMQGCCVFCCYYCCFCCYCCCISYIYWWSSRCPLDHSEPWNNILSKSSHDHHHHHCKNHHQWNVTFPPASVSLQLPPGSSSNPMLEHSKHWVSPLDHVFCVKSISLWWEAK